MSNGILYTPELAVRICEELAAGKSLSAICAAPGMPTRHSVRVWVTSRPDFRAQYEAARLAWADSVFEEITDLGEAASRAAADADARGGNASAAVAAIREQIHAKQWVLARLRPDKYGDRIATEVSGLGGKNLIPDRDADPLRVAHAMLLLLQTASPKQLAALEDDGE